MNRPTLAVIALGGATIAAALVWWWATFSTFVHYGNLSWPDAGRCLVRDSDICALAKVLCLSAHPRVFFAYWTGGLLGRRGDPVGKPVDGAEPPSAASLAEPSADERVLGLFSASVALG